MKRDVDFWKEELSKALVVIEALRETVEATEDVNSVDVKGWLRTTAMLAEFDKAKRFDLK